MFQRDVDSAFGDRCLDRYPLPPADRRETGTPPPLQEDSRAKQQTLLAECRAAWNLIPGLKVPAKARFENELATEITPAAVADLARFTDILRRCMHVRTAPVCPPKNGRRSRTGRIVERNL